MGLLFSTESGHTRPSSRELVGNFNQKLSIAQARTCCNNNNNNRNGSFVVSRVSKTGRKGIFGCYFSYSNSTSDKRTIKHLPPLPLVQTTTFVRVGEVTNRKREKKINSKRPRERESWPEEEQKKRDGHAVAAESNTGNTISLPTGSMDCVHRSLQRIRLWKSIQSTTTFRQNRHK